MLELHEKLRSQPWPEQWADEQRRALAAEGVTDAADTVWGRELMDAAKRDCVCWAQAFETALSEIRSGGGEIEKAYAPSFTATAEALRDFARALGGDWDEARAFAAIPFPRLGSLRNYDDTSRKARVTSVRDACKKAAAEWAQCFAEDSATLLTELRSCATSMGTLLDLALEFDAAFSAEKRRRGCLDFSDLEHYAAQLLVDRESGLPTWNAAEWAGRFEEVMVDEYQDVSPIQDLIFRAVSRNGRNLFLVGDVKQSIYRFRLADPSLFLEKYHSYAPAEQAEEGQPRRILLQENFRSRRSVLEASNAVFSQLMSEDLGELDYDDDAALRFGAKGYPEEDEPPVEFALIEAEGGADGEDFPPEKSEREALYVAGRIREMMEAGAPVHTPEGARRCTWSDFVLLLRSPGGRGAVYRRVLAEQGIPVDVQQGGGFFTSLEITVAVNLLSLIDNPHADVPLISVLRSPVFAFSADELSAIRTGSPDTDYYAALRSAAERGDGKSTDFLRQLEGWRALASDLLPEELLRRVCADTGLFAICAAMADGKARRRNLTKLFEYARGFSAGGNRGLYRFVNWLRRLAEKGVEPEVAPEGDAVRILSIHRSKGLEFPFVFLCDLEHQFNKSDARDRVLIHPALGLGPKYTDPDLGVEYPTLARRAVAQRLVREMLSEEMRVLYVGMTRAREKLVLTAARRNASQTLDTLRESLTLPLSPALLRSAASPARWLILAALADGERHLRLRLVEILEAGTPGVEDKAEDGPADDAVYARLARKLSFAYPHAGAVSLPSKLTATELKREALPEDPEAASMVREPIAYHFRNPEPGTHRNLSAAEKGTATHLFLQHLNLHRAGSTEELCHELDRLTALGRLRPEERAAISPAAVVKLFASPLGKRMREASELWREFRFTLLTEADEFFEEAEPGERLLLQGVVDCWFVENGQITIVDYKTDRVTAGGAPERAEHYRPQLETYAVALQRITGLPVAQKALWFLTPGVEIEL